jgi:hypothetical protein
VVDDYYRIPERIKAITKERIITISNAMFTENLWGIGVLGDCGPDFANQLRHEIQPLWEGKLAPSKASMIARPKVVFHGRRS